MAALETTRVQAWPRSVRAPIEFWYKLVGVVGFDVAVSFLPLRQCRFVSRQLLVRDLLQEVGDDVQTSASFVVRAHHMPRRPGGVGGFEHVVARTRVIVPAAVGLEVHRRQLPDLTQIVDSRFEPTGLLLLAYLQPIFDEDDA